MGFRIAGPHVVAFLEFARQQEPDYGSFAQMSPTARRELVRRFKHIFPSDLMMSDAELRNLVDHGFSRIAEEGYSVVDNRSGVERWLTSDNTQDALARYLDANANGIFLYTEQDVEFQGYLRDFWRSLDREAASILHFFDYGLSDGIRHRFRSPNRTYTFAENYIRGLSPIPAADLTRIRAVGLPCFLVWSHEGESAIVPFADVQGDQSATRDRFRLILDRLADKDVSSLRTLFEPIVKTAVSRSTEVFISYRHADRTWVSGLSTAIKKLGLAVWFDDEQQAGERWDIRIRHMLARAKTVLVVWSKQSVTSDYVMSEADYARQTKKILPVYMEKPLDLPVPFNTIHALDLSSWLPPQPLPINFELALRGAN